MPPVRECMAMDWIKLQTTAVLSKCQGANGVLPTEKTVSQFRALALAFKLMESPHG